MLPIKVRKRDGRIVDFTTTKIFNAIKLAFNATRTSITASDLTHIVYTIEKAVIKQLETEQKTTIDVETIQDIVETALLKEEYYDVAKAYMLYRAERSRIRDRKSNIMKTLNEITFASATDSDMKRENANINTDSPMGIMLKYGTETAKEFTLTDILSEEASAAHRNGDIRIHDLDFYSTGTLTCVQIDLLKLFEDGFNTGHGFIREPGSIRSYAALACIAIQSSQNDFHGGQSVPNFEYAMAKGINKSFRKAIAKAILYKTKPKDGSTCLKDNLEVIKSIMSSVESRMNVTLVYRTSKNLKDDFDYILFMTAVLKQWVEISDISLFSSFIDEVTDIACMDVEDETMQAMEAVVHNLCSMHSRAGSQVPFSSLNFGTDTTDSGRLAIKCILKATENGLGNGETAIFPISIFRVKDGINYKPGDPNYDLYRYAMEVSAKRLFPNFLFLDAPYNLKYYEEGKVETYATAMGCRTRVLANVNGPAISHGRGNLSFTTINLPRLAIQSNKNLDAFFTSLDKMLDLVIDQLYQRYEYQATKKVKNFPFAMGQGIWLDSDTLDPDDSIEKIIRHGTLSIGYVGLSETLTALIGKHHGESEAAQELGLKIIGHMRDRCDKASEDRKMNYTLLATPAESLAGHFLRMDKKEFGTIPGVTDKDYYTNSCHITPSYQISAYDKIRLEAPYHALSNAGHICYVELDGDVSKNIDAFEQILAWMHDEGVGYGSINHPCDRDPVCGYVGIIKDVCPRCGRREGESVSVEKLRKLGVNIRNNITSSGYYGDINEESDRIPNKFIFPVCGCD